MRKFLIILSLFIAVGAVGGAIMMWVDPSGNGWGGAPMLDLLRPKMPWPDVLFKNFIPSGFVLLAVNGLPQFLAALMLIKKHPLAYWVTLACGILLMLWICLEWWVWGFATISNIYFTLGLLEAAAAIKEIKKNP
ncbi:MAG: hypothetical protein IKX28_07810 [Bacteroidales bacterium]|nr:hypothetical protein [Bacteroidales bacterium]